MMKTIISLTLLCFLCFSTIAQVPQKMSYQAVIRDNGGRLIINQVIGMRISILQGSPAGTAVYVETQMPSTNENGLATLEIGGGTVVSGSFTGINWSTGVYYVKTETDIAGGTNYTITGISQLLSVPYALYALTTDFSAFKDYLDSLLNRIEVLEGTKIKDIDNNVYKTITIGTQIWMGENLRTTRYNDGTPIPKVTDNSVWDELSTGAYCWVNNDSASFENLYGKLYNFYAVNSGKLCPASWHVPTDAEWTTLADYLIANGYNYDGTTSGNKIGKSLAATTNWESTVVTGAVGNSDYPACRNKSGFSSLPGGYRFSTGAFYNVGRSAYWWSSTQAPTSNYGWLRYQNFDSVSLTRISYQMLNGYSVRCVKN